MFSVHITACSDEHLCDNKELSPKEFIEMWLL